MAALTTPVTQILNIVLRIHNYLYMYEPYTSYTGVHKKKKSYSCFFRMCYLITKTAVCSVLQTVDM